MRSLVPKLLIASVALLATLVWVPGALAATPTFSGAFKLTSSEALSSNNKIIAGPDGNVWFTVQTVGKEVAKITPSGVITEYALPEASGATGLAAGPEGKIWLTGVEKAISFSPSNPEGTEQHFKVESIGANGQIVLGANGEMWVASNNEITHFSPASPEAENGSFTPVGALTPLDIDRSGSGLVVASANSGRLLTIDAAGKQGPDIPLGGETMTAQGVAGTSGSAQVAFSKSDQSEGLGLVTPPAAPTPALMPGDPFGVATGADGNYWFAMSAAHGIERLTPSGQATALAFPGFEKWFPRQITAGPGGTLWVTMEVPGENEYAIARVTGVEPPAPPSTGSGGTSSGGGTTTATKPVPDTTLGKGFKKVVTTEAGKATVRISFSSSVAGSTFQCSLVKVPAPKKGKKKKTPTPAFADCTSPRVLHLAPGKYRFAVRANAAGVTDASPAESAFTVVRRQQRPKHR